MWDIASSCIGPRYQDTGEVRDLRRTTLEGDGPTAVQSL